MKGVQGNPRAGQQRYRTGPYIARVHGPRLECHAPGRARPKQIENVMGRANTI